MVHDSFERPLKWVNFRVLGRSTHKNRDKLYILFPSRTPVCTILTRVSLFWTCIQHTEALRLQKVRDKDGHSHLRPQPTTYLCTSLEKSKVIDLKYQDF